MIVPLNPPAPIEAWRFNDGPGLATLAVAVIVNPETGRPTGVIAMSDSRFEFFDNDHYQKEWRQSEELEAAKP